MPTVKSILECEYRLLRHFDRNFNLMLPMHFVKMYLAQGILFSNEIDQAQDLEVDLARRLSIEALSLCEKLSIKGAYWLYAFNPSVRAAIAIYYARRNVFTSPDAVKIPSLWPYELVLLTRCTEA